MSELFDPFEDEDEFKDDPDTKSILGRIDEVIAKKTPQESYDWLCDLENRIGGRVDAVVANPEVKG